MNQLTILTRALAFILIVFMPFLNALNSSILNFKNVNEKLEDLANIILRDYFASNKCLVVISENGILRNLIFNNSRVYIEINSSLEDCNMTLNSFLKETFKQNCDGYLVGLKRPACGLEGWHEVNRQSFVPRHNPKYFFLPLVEEDESIANLTAPKPGAVDELMKSRISDISQDILLGQLDIKNNDDWRVILWTNNFYEHPTETNRTTNKFYLDEWRPERGFKLNEFLYPDKLKDLRGKRFRIAILTYLPFTISDPLDGMEVRIARQFCIFHNCTPVGVTDDFLWGTVYTNLTGVGVLGNAYSDEADIGAAGVFLWLNEHYFIDYSDSYLWGEVSVLTPRPQRIGGWATPFLPFKMDLWYFIFLSVVLSAIFLFLLTKASIRLTRFGDKLMRKAQFTSLTDSLMRALGLVVLQQPSSRLIRDSPNRYLFTSFEFVYLILSAMYSAELASFLTVPRFEKPIDTFHEFAVSGLTWYGTHEAFTYALKEGTDRDTRAIINHFRVLSEEELVAAAKEGKNGFVAERLPGGSMLEQSYITAEVLPLYHLMKGYLFGSPLVVTMKKGGPYNKEYNRLVNQVVEHGLSLYWEAETVRHLMDSRIQAQFMQINTMNVDSTPQVIRIENIIGVIYLYLIGALLAGATFIWELILPRLDGSTRRNDD